MCVEEYKSVNLRKKVTKFRHSLNTKQALSREYAFFSSRVTLRGNELAALAVQYISTG
jgi:hypothetical protein